MAAYKEDLVSALESSLQVNVLCRLAKSIFPLKDYILRVFISFQQSCVSLFLVTDNVEKDGKMVDVNQSGELCLVLSFVYLYCH